MVKIDKRDIHVKILHRNNDKLDRIRVEKGLTKGQMFDWLIDNYKELKV